MNEIISNGTTSIDNLSFQALLYKPRNEKSFDLSLFEAIGRDVSSCIVQSLLRLDTLELGFLLEPRTLDDFKIEDLKSSFQILSNQAERLQIGFPYLSLTQNQKEISAPLFFWDLHISLADDNSPQHWIFELNASGLPVVNEALKNYLIAQFDLDWNEIFILDELAKPKDFNNSLHRLAKELQCNISSFRRIHSFHESTTDPYTGIQNLGFFGLPEQQAQQEVTEELSIGKSRRIWFTRVGALSSNPVQESFVNDVLEGKDALLLGAADTGKTRAICSLLPSVISDHGTCLYITPNLSTFSDINKQLESVGLNDSGILMLQDELTVKEKLFSALEELPEAVKKLPKFDENQYNLSLQQYLFFHNSLSDRFEAIRKPVLDQSKWSEVVSLFLTAQQKDAKQYLARILDTSTYDWTWQEYNLIRSAVEENLRLFKKIGDIQHPLNQIQSHVFLQNKKETAKSWVNDQLTTYTSLLTDLFKRYTKFIDEYSDDLRFQYESHIKNLKQRINDIQRDIRVYRDVYGDSFNMTDGFTTTRLRILSVFSKKHRQILAAKEHIYKSIEELRAVYESKKYFEANIPSGRTHTLLSDLRKDLTELDKLADQFLNRVPKIVNSKIKELSHKIPLKPSFKRKYEELDLAVEQFFTNLSKNSIFVPFSFEKTQKAIEKEEQLKNTLSAFSRMLSRVSDFEDYFEWRKSWFLLDQKVRNTVEAIVTVNPTDALASFDSWYLYYYLEKKYHLHLPDGDFPILDFQQVIREIRELLPKNALLTCREQQAEQLRNMKKDKGWVPAQFKNKYYSFSIPHVIDDLGLSFITDNFPIIVMTPEVADKVFGNQIAIFDLVILDDAHLIDAKLGKKLSRLAAQRVISGSTSASSKETLLEYSTQLESFERFYFKNIYNKEGKLVSTYQSNYEHQSLVQFQEAISNYLQKYIGSERILTNVQIDEHVFVDIVVKSVNGSTLSLGFVIDGWLNQVDKYDLDSALEKSRKSRILGYEVHPLWSVEWWRSPENAAEEMVGFILNWDKAN